MAWIGKTDWQGGSSWRKVNTVRAYYIRGDKGTNWGPENKGRQEEGAFEWGLDERATGLVTGQ